MGTKVSIPPFKDPQLLNFAREIQFALGQGQGTQTGQGKPRVKRGDTEGSTYWNATDNNYWIFRNGNWMQLDSGLNANLKTGQVTKSITGEFYGWYYRYLTIRYADTVDADDYNVYSVTGFSQFPTNKRYYGTYNFDDPGAVNIEDPTKYLWSNTDIPNNTFGVNQFYFYETKGGRRYAYAIAQLNGQPDGNYTTFPTGPYVDLDVITTALGPVVVDGEQVIRYANNLFGTLDYSSTATNRSFIGYWSKAEWTAANPTEKENPANYIWKMLPATVGPTDRVFAAANPMGGIQFEVGTQPSDQTKFSDLTYQATPTNPSFDPNMRSGYVVTQMVSQSGGSGVMAMGSGTPIAGAGAVQIGLPFVGQQGTYDTRTYPFITVDAYGRVAALNSTNSQVEYFLASKNFYRYSGSTTITLDHVTGQILVYLNGILLVPGSDYTEGTATGNISPTITIPRWTAGNVTVYRLRKVTGAFEQVDSAPFSRLDTVADADTNRITLPPNTAAQSEIIWINGIQLPDSEYTYMTIGGSTFAVLVAGETIPAGSNITIITFALVNSVAKFNQGNTATTAGQSMFTFPNAPRPNNIIPSPLTYQLAFTISGVLVDENTLSPVFVGDYIWPLGSKTVNLNQPAAATAEPLQYTVWVSDLAYT